MDTAMQLDIIFDELRYSLGGVQQAEVDKTIALIENAPKVFVLGLGRGGYAIKAFGMRLMHMGKDAHSVFEMGTPNLQENDVLIVASGSGGTSLMNQMARKAKGFGGKIVAFTTNGDSELAGMADAKLVLRAPSKKQSDSGFQSKQPMASLYEQSVMLLGDAIVLQLMERSTKKNEEMFGRHANLD